MHPLDGIRVDVRGDHLHRGRQVDDDGVFRRRVHDVDDRVADLGGKLQLGAGKRFRGVLPAPVRVRVVLGDVLDQVRGIRGQLLDGRLVLAEDHAALQLRGGVVEVHDDVLRALAGLEGAADEVLARLDQDLDGDVVRDEIPVDDLAHEVEVRLRGRREAHLNFLVSHLDQELEHAQLALRAHRVDQRLVAVAQVHRAPLRRMGRLLVGPRAIREGDVFDLDRERLVAVDRHLGTALLVPRGLIGSARAVRRGDFARGGDIGIARGHGRSRLLYFGKVFGRCVVWMCAQSARPREEARRGCSPRRDADRVCAEPKSACAPTVLEPVTGAILAPGWVPAAAHKEEGGKAVPRNHVTQPTSSPIG